LSLLLFCQEKKTQTNRRIHSQIPGSIF